MKSENLILIGKFYNHDHFPYLFIFTFILGVLKAICKSRHWNLSIGIEIGNGIGTDITNAIISSSIRPMDPKISRVVT